jgi:hypothetical protein
MCILWSLELRKNVCANLYYDGNAYFNKSCSCCEGCKLVAKRKDEGEREGIGLAIGFFMHCSYYNWLIVDGLSIIVDFFAKYNQLCEEEKKLYKQIINSSISLQIKLIFWQHFHLLNWNIPFNNIID